MSFSAVWSLEEFRDGKFIARISLTGFKPLSFISEKNFQILDEEGNSHTWPIEFDTQDNQNWDLTAIPPDHTFGGFHFRLLKDSIRYQEEDEERQGPEGDIDSRERLITVFRQELDIGTEDCPDTPPEPPYVRWFRPIYYATLNVVEIEAWFLRKDENGALVNVKGVSTRDLRFLAQAGSHSRWTWLGIRRNTDPNTRRSTIRASDLVQKIIISIRPPSNYNHVFSVRFEWHTVTRVLDDGRTVTGPVKRFHYSDRINVDNRPPILDFSTASRTFDERTNLTNLSPRWKATGTRIERYEIAKQDISGDGRRNWLTIDPTTGEFGGTAPTNARGFLKYTYTLTAYRQTYTPRTDTATIKITVINTDKPSVSPRASTLTVDEGTEISASDEFLFRAGTNTVQNWTLNIWTGLPALGDENWLEIKSQNHSAVRIGSFKPAPAVASGTTWYIYHVTATNNAGSTVVGFSVGVRNRSKPKINSIANKPSVDEGEQVSIDITLEDPTVTVTEWTLTLQSITDGDGNSVPLPTATNGLSADNWLFMDSGGPRVYGQAPSTVSAEQETKAFAYSLEAENGAGSHTTCFTITVHNTTPPQLQANLVDDPKNINEGALLQFAVHGTEMTNVVLTQPRNVTWLKLYTGALYKRIHGTPWIVSGYAPSNITGKEGTKSYNYTLTASNNTSSTSTFSFEVIVANTNPPTNVSVNAPTNPINENSVVNAFKATGTDVQTWSIRKTGGTGGFDWFRINSSTGRIYPYRVAPSGRIYRRSPGIPSGNLTYTYTVTATNNLGADSAVEVSFTVTVRNTTPSINSFSNFNINEETDVSGKQASGEAISGWDISMSTAGTNWLSIDYAGNITGTSPSVTSGSAQYSFTIEATGLDSTTTTETFTVTVYNTTAPQIQLIGNRTVKERSLVVIGPRLVDSGVISNWTFSFRSVTDENRRTLSATHNDRTWFSFNSSFRLITGYAPTITGTRKIYNYRVRATNTVGVNQATGFDNEDFSITVTDTTYTATWTGQHYCTTNNKLRANISFSHRVTDVDKDDFEVVQVVNDADVFQSSWVFDDLSITRNQQLLFGRTLLISAQVPAQTDGFFKLRIKRRVVSFDGSTSNNGPLIVTTATPAVEIDNRVFLIVTPGWTNEAGGETLVGTINFYGAAVTSIEIDDFVVIDNSSRKTEQTGWVITFPPQFTSGSVSAGGTIRVRATPPTNPRVNGQFKLRLKGSSVRSGGSPLDEPNNAPSDHVDFNAAQLVNNLKRVAVRSFKAPTGNSSTNRVTSATTTFTLTLDRQVPANQVTPEDFTPVPSTRISSVSPTTGNSNIYSVVVTNPVLSRTAYRIKLNSKSIHPISTSTYRRGPLDDFYSDYVYCDTRPSVSVTTFTPPSTTSRSPNKLDSTVFILTLSHRVPTGELIKDDFTRSDTNASISSIYGVNQRNGKTNQYNINVANPTNAAGSYYITLGTNTISEGDNYKQGPLASPRNTAPSVYYDTRVAVASWSHQLGGTRLTARLNFTIEGVNGLSGRNDFDVLDNARPPNVQSGWTIILGTNDGTVTVNSFTTVEARPPTNTQGSFKLRFNALSVKCRRSSINNAPINDVTWTSAESVNNYPRVSASSLDPKDTRNSSSRPVRVASGVFRLSLDRSVPTGQITAADFTPSVSGLTVASPLPQDTSGGNASIWDISVTNPVGRVGSYTLTFNQWAIDGDNTLRYRSGPDPEKVSGELYYDTRKASGTWSALFGGESLGALLTFYNVGASNITIDDFLVLTSAGSEVSNQNDWTIKLPPLFSGSVGPGGATVVIAEPPPNTNGSFKLRLKANSVLSQGRTGNNEAPTANQDWASPRPVNNYPKAVVESFKAPTEAQRGPTTIFRLKLKQTVPTSEITRGDFSPPNPPNGTSITGVSPVNASNGRALEYDVTATNPVNKSGYYRISLNADSITANSVLRYRQGPVWPFYSTLCSFNTIPRVATAIWGAVSYSTTTGKLSTTLTFQVASITGNSMAVEDFQIVDNYNPANVQSGWRFDTIPQVATVNVAFTIAATPPPQTHGRFRFRILGRSVKSDNASENNAPAAYKTSDNDLVDNRTFIPATASWDGEDGGTTLTGTVTFGAADVTEVAAEDFEVVTSSNGETYGETYGWTITLPSTFRGSVLINGTLLVTATPPTPPPYTYANFRLKLKDDSVKSDESPFNNAPDGNVISDQEFVDNRPQLMVSTFDPPNGVQTGVTSTCQLTFDRSIFASELTHADFTLSTSAASINRSTGVRATDEFAGLASIFDITITNPRNSAGAYTVTLLVNSVSSTSTYKQGPSVVATARVSYNTVPTLSASWGPVSSPSLTANTDRSVVSTLTFTGTGGVPTGLDLQDHIRIEKVVDGSPIFDPFTNTNLYEDTAYDQTITATGTAPITITSTLTSGTLPENVTLVGPRLYSTGNPRIITDLGTTFTITFTASNSVGTTRLVIGFAIAKNRLPAFIDFPVQRLSENNYYNKTIRATGSPSPTITSRITANSLPNNISTYGLTLNGATFSGTPINIPDNGAILGITYTATSGIHSVNKVVTYYISGATNQYTAPSFNAFTQTSLREGFAFNQTITAAGNPTPTITSQASRAKIVRAFYARPASTSAITTIQKDNIDTMIKRAQTFFSDQMNSHGYGRQTFDIQTDSNGKVEVEEVLLSNTNRNRLINEISSIRSRYPYDINVFFLSYDADSSSGGWAGLGQNYSFVDGPTWTWRNTAHEIGHNLWLEHSDAGGLPSNLMYGFMPSRTQVLSTVSAEKLNRLNSLYRIGVLAIPTGLTLNGAALSGTPAVGTAGTFTITFTARNTIAVVKKTIIFTIVSAGAPIFGSFTQTALYEDTAYDQTITATGTPTPTITSRVTSGFLPDNMTLDGARLYSTGNPQIIADAGTTFTVTFTATNTGGTETRAVNFTIAANRLPVFDDFAISNRFLTEGTAYSQTVTATGVPTPTITSSYISGPTGGLSDHGLTLSGATISGTPTSVPDSGFFFTINFTATSTSGTTTMRLSFYVNNRAPSVPANRYAAPSFNSFSPTTLIEGQMSTPQIITATGNPTPVITSALRDTKTVHAVFR